MRDRDSRASFSLRDVLSLRLVRWLIGMLLVAGVLLGIAYCTAESMIASRPVEVEQPAP